VKYKPINTVNFIIVKLTTDSWSFSDCC